MAKSPSRPLDSQLTLFSKHPTNYQSNLFTESRQEFTELEKKIVTLVVNQLGHLTLNSGEVPKSNVLVRIPFMELTKVRYDQIADAAESLSKKRLSFRGGKNDEFTFLTPFPLVQSATVDGLRVIEITMLANVVPYFAELGQRYTKYDIDIMLSLSSVYAQRMFEIVSMFYHRGQREFRYQVDELRTILNCPDTYRYNDFCKNALEVAQRELENKAGLFLQWTPSQKKGKKVIELEFSILTTQQLALQQIEQDRKTISQMSINEAVITAWSAMSDYKLKGWQKDLIVSEHHLLEIFLRVHSELVNGLRPTVKNPTAYLVRSLGIDQLKAPDKKKGVLPTGASTSSGSALSPDTRTGRTSSLADLFSDLLPPKHST